MRYGFGNTFDRSLPRLGVLNSFNKTYCSYYFNGVDSYLKEDANTAINTLVSGSSKVWSHRIVFRRLQSGMAETLVANWDTAGNNRSFVFLFRLDDTLRFRFSYDGINNTGDYTTAFAFNDTDWHDLVFTYNAATVKCFVDGVLDVGTSTTIPALVYNNGLDTRYGAVATVGATLPFNGYINQVAWTSDIITNSEVTTLYNGGSPRISSEILDNMYNETIYDNDTWNGSEWNVIDDISSNDLVSVNMDAVDKDCNENPY